MGIALSVVLVEALAGVDTRLALVDVLLEDRRDAACRAVRVLGGGAGGDDVVRRGQADDVEDAEGSQWRARAKGPRGINRLHVRDPVGQQRLGGVEEGDEHAVEQVSRLLLLELEGDHADGAGELDHRLV